MAKQSIPLRGDNERLGDPKNGNFLQLMQTIASFDDVMADHFAQQSKRNEIIDALGSAIKKHITAGIKENLYYSVIADCTPDVSHREQM